MERDVLSDPAETLASRPIDTCALDDTVTQAPRRMRDRRVSCLIVDSRPPGLVTATDLRHRVLAAGLDPETPVRQVMTTPLHTTPADSTLGEVVLAMVDRAGTPAADVTRFVTSAHDALYVRAARDAEAALGPPPCPYGLLVLGSGARRESTLRTDQGHALVLADGAPPGADGWFAALGDRLAATLDQCGLTRCPGDVMVTNPARRVPLRGWQEQLTHWMEEPDEDAVLAAAIYFDFRQLHGELDAEAPLRRVIGQAAGNRRFLGRLAVAALWRRPPLGFLHHLRGDHHGRIDWPMERVPDDTVPLAELTALHRRWLNDTAQLVRTCQESVRIAYRTDLIG